MVYIIATNFWRLSKAGLQYFIVATHHWFLYFHFGAILGRSTLPSKRNATLVLGASLTPIWGQRPHGVKRLRTGVVSPILSHKSRLLCNWPLKLPLFTTFCPYWVVDPKLGSWELFNQVLRFFWRGVYIVCHGCKVVIYFMATTISTNFPVR